MQGICRRLLRNEHDVEDVFQATFLVLAHKAAGIAWRESVGGWLGAVAHRLALSARADASRQHRRETPMTRIGRNDSPAWRDVDAEGRLPEKYHPLADPFVEIERRDLRRLLDDELLHLPEKYRAPVVLCDLEGRTHQEAARQLGWPSGSMSRRLKRAQGPACGGDLSIAASSLAIGLVVFGFRGSRRWSHPPRRPRRGRGPLGDDFAQAAHETARRRHPSRWLPGSLEHDASPSTTRSSPWPGERPRSRPEIERSRARARIGTSGGNTPPRCGVQRSLLAQATQENDHSAMLSAARRLDASCLRCHEVFR